MREKTHISPKLMLLLVLGTLILSFAYYFIGAKFMHSPLSYSQYLVFTTVLAIVIAGGYQIFFWVQRNNFFFRETCLKIWIDGYIPFWPVWVWIYSFLYYVMIGYVIVSIRSIEEGIYLIFGGLVLLFIQSLCFLVFPCIVPPKWRQYKANSFSKKYLKFIQGIDNGRNCFPSMHCAVAAYVGLILFPVLSFYSIIFIVSIVLSSLFTKQHQIIDTLAGVLLGCLVYILVL
ncbi:phosphatase PAP2 family protein [Candidatus Woesearchaeota archaeon]|nr:phosphatase PAP2 family protein [Candidatus Woesearchaeota archaeon]